MQRLRKNYKLVLTTLLSALTISCATNLPKPPDGRLYLHDAVSSRALCSELNTGVECPAVPLGETNRWYMLEPQTLQKLMEYIDELIYEIQKPQIQSNEKKKESIELTVDHLRQLRQKIQDAQNLLNAQ